ncbi:unnamed protein product [Wickerhamomyces anomalus]
MNDQQDNYKDPETVIKYEEFHGAFNEDDYIDIPPDGGYGWFCTAYISAMNFATWGPNCAWGVFLSFYLKNPDLFPGGTATDFGLIGGIIVFLTLCVIPYSAVLLLKIGYRWTLALGITIQLGGYIGASFATTIGQLYVTQGLLIGISFGLIFGANSIVLPSWFLKKRALANGLSHIGVGLGGAVFAPSIDKLLQKTGNHKWAYRMLAIVSFVICSSMMFLIKVRVPKNSTIQNKQDKSIKQVFKHIFDYKVWKSLPLQLATLWACLIAFGYYICLFSLSNYATTLGYSQHQAMIVTVVLNLSQAVGRPLMGVFSELFGRVNFTMFATLYSLVLIFVFWINLKNYSSLIVFAIMLGLLFGIGSVNVVPLVVDVVGLNSFAAGLGWANTFTGTMSLIAEVIALNLRDYTLTKHTPYFYCQIFVGCMYFLALISLIPYRQWKVKRMLYQLKNSKTVSEDQRQEFMELYEDRGVKGYVKRAFMVTKV